MVKNRRQNVAYKIRRIQQGTSDNQDKVKEVRDLFSVLIKKSADTALILQAVQNAVCDNITTNSNLVPMALPCGFDADEANLLTYNLGLYISKGESGTVYLSWSRQMFDTDIEHWCQMLHEAGHEGLLNEEFERLKRYNPENKLDLIFTSSEEDANKMAEVLGKNAYCVFKDAVYLLSL